MKTTNLAGQKPLNPMDALCHLKLANVKITLHQCLRILDEGSILLYIAAHL